MLSREPSIKKSNFGKIRFPATSSKCTGFNSGEQLRASWPLCPFIEFKVSFCSVQGPVQQVNQSAPSFNPPPATLQTIMASNVDGGIQNIANMGSTEQQVVGEFVYKAPGPVVQSIVSLMSS